MCVLQTLSHEKLKSNLSLIECLQQLYYGSKKDRCLFKNICEKYMSSFKIVFLSSVLPFQYYFNTMGQMLVLCNKCCHQRKKYQDLSSSLIPLLYPMVAGVTKPPYTRSSAPTGYAYTIGILERLILHLHGYLITGSSGTAVGGKGLRGPPPLEKKFVKNFY